ncbi:MAG TPA: integrase core domain-containing protein, partial [Chloroflexota bacterium]|nr:integrase core domain-containing protein [Chloroflexota bacterium]
GAVERAQRTHTEEFYECSFAAPTVAELGAQLRTWEVVYNTVRPHQARSATSPHWSSSRPGIVSIRERSRCNGGSERAHPLDNRLANE